MYRLHSPNPELVLCLEVCSLSARHPGILICFAWNPDKLKPSLPDSMDCFNPASLSAFMKSFGTLMLWLFLWTAKNLASLPLSMDWSEPNNFACFYEKLGTLILCLFLGIHMYWLHSPNPELFLCLELRFLSAWNPETLLCSAWNPASFPDSMDCSEPSLFVCFYKKLGTLML